MMMEGSGNAARKKKHTIDAQVQKQPWVVYKREESAKRNKKKESNESTKQKILA